jgi:hypothetical protein
MRPQHPSIQLGENHCNGLLLVLPVSIHTTFSSKNFLWETKVRLEQYELHHTLGICLDEIMQSTESVSLTTVVSLGLGI